MLRSFLTILTAVVFAAALCSPAPAAYLEYVSGGFTGLVTAEIGLNRDTTLEHVPFYPSLGPLSATVWEGRLLATGMASAWVAAQAEARGTGVTLSGESKATTITSLFRRIGERSLYAYGEVGTASGPSGYGPIHYQIAGSEGEADGQPIMIRANLIADRSEGAVAEANVYGSIYINDLLWTEFSGLPLHAEEWWCSLAHIGDDIFVDVRADSSSFRWNPTPAYSERMSASFTLDLDVFYFEPLDPRDFPYEFDPFLFKPIKVETGHFALLELETGRVQVIPLPAGVWLLGSGLLGLWGLGRRRKQ